MDSLTWDWQVTLQKKIKDILAQYPDDGQILKEIIQNAEDGKAKCVKFLYDKNSYTTYGLEDPTLAEHQGEALYAYNDAIFTNEDFRNLLNIGKSYKQADRTKVGRFGQGFKSIFHMTELPTLLSGKYIAKISPYKEKLPCGEHCKVYQQFPAEFRSLQGEFQGYTESDASNGVYNGTLFRFPLRKTESEISKTLYGEEKVMDLFNALRDRAFMNLLFLKSLETIEVYVQEVNERTPRLQFRICITNTSTEILKKRTEFFQEIGTGSDLDERYITYRVDLQLHTPGPAGDVEETRSFLVCHYYNDNDVSSAMKELLSDEQLSYLPLVGVAMPVGQHERLQQPDGHIFCFLPLPIHENTSPTGLPVHINSFFVVSSDRSEVKWPTAGQSHDKMSNSLKWNQCLLEELIPRAYARLLLDATQRESITPDDICHAFPNIDMVNEKLKNTFLPPFLQQVFTLPILPTVGADIRSFVTVSDEATVLCAPSIDSETLVALVKILTGSQKNAVSIPEHMMKALRSTGWNKLLKEATPSFVCQLMKSSDCYKMCSRQVKLHLLEYLLQGQGAVTPTGLIGLELLPCADGTFTAFLSTTAAAKIYIATSQYQKLLPTLEHQFLSNDINKELLDILQSQDVIGRTQLTKGTDDDILSLLNRVFPQGVDDRCVIDCDKEATHLTCRWIEDIWEFLVSISATHPDHLNRVKHLHLLPIPDSSGRLHLSKLCDGAICIAKQLHDEILPEKVSDALALFGVTLLDNVPEYIKRHPYVFDQHCIYQPNPGSVMSALLKKSAATGNGNSSPLGITNFNRQATREHRLAYLQFFEPLRSERAQDLNKSFLRQLHLFETIDGSGHQPRHYSSVNEVSSGVSCYSIPVNPPCQLLDMRSLDAQVMTEYIGIKLLTETMVVEKYIFEEIREGRIIGTDLDKVMLFCLKNLDVHERASDTFRRCLTKLSFLSDKQGNYHRASECFDPRDSVLQNLFQGEEKFPGEVYIECLDQLIKLGLKGRRNVVASDVLRSAELVDRGSKDPNRVADMTSESTLQSKSRGIADVIENGVVFNNTEREQLRQLSWVPVERAKPNQQVYPSSLPWGGVTDEFQPPNSVCLSSQIPVVGSTMPSLRTTVVSDSIVNKVFGTTQPPLARIIQHLKNIVEVFKPEEKVVFLGFVKQIYEALKTYREHSVKECLTDESLSEWLWHGSGFTTMDHMSKNLSEEMGPYAFRIPDELQNNVTWLRKMGVKENCDWVQVVFGVKQWHDSQTEVSEAKVNRDLKIVKQALEKIVALNPEGVPENLRATLVLPVQDSDCRLKLLPMSECTYFEDNYAFGVCVDGEGGDGNFLHESISKSLAEAMGVKTSMNRLFEADSEGYTVVEGHGQEESLTHRLKVLLQDYPDGLAIPKELIQNADDAGATQVKFMYDERENLDARSGLIDDGMTECQGPALWVYNDKTFSEEDLENIKKLSGATKERKSDKIGKFGLGFNVVYNVTDVPSFITNKSIVFFDPHKSHLGRARQNRDDAGLRINLFSGTASSAHLRKKFYNQFMTYNNVFGCRLEKEGTERAFEGTLFRLPLRLSGSKSEIKSMPYTTDDVKELFQLIIDQASNMLLFTQSVKSIELHHLPKSVKDPSQSVKIFGMNALPSPLKPLPHVSVASTNDTLLKICSKLVKGKSAVPPNELSRSSIVLSTRQFNSSNILGIKGRMGETHWLVHDCIGTKASMTFARKSDPQSYVPVAGIAIQMDKEHGTYRPVVTENESSQVFCHLPLPSSVKSGLPVIMNGSFAIKPDRRQIVQITSDDKNDNAMDRWNEVLKKDAITQAYVGALVQAKDIMNQDVDPYSLWPKRSVDKVFESVYNGFYELIATYEQSSAPQIFTNGEVWFDYHHAVFLDDNLACSDLRDVALKLLQAYLDRTSPPQGRMIATVLPGHLNEGFSKFNIREKVLTCAQVYEKAILPCLQHIGREERSRLILFALNLVPTDTNLSNLLRNSICIPVQPAGTILVKPTQLVSPVGKLSNLFETADGVFPIQHYCQEETLRYLKMLGMNVDQMSWDMIIERAESLQTADLHRGEEKLRYWVQHVDQKLQRYGDENKPSPAQIERLKSIRFLPVMPEPLNHPIAWKGNELIGGLAASAEVFPSSLKNLVGSIRYIVDEKKCGLSVGFSMTKVRQLLGLEQRTPSLDDMMTQMKRMATVEPSESTRKKVGEICSEIYGHLDERCKTSNDATKIQSELREVKCIYTGQSFTYPKYCAKEGKGIRNFLHIVNIDLRSKQRLLSVLGVKNNFQATDYIAALQKITPSTDVKLVRELAEALQSWLYVNKRSLESIGVEPDQICLPTEENISGEKQILPVKDLCLNASGNYTQTRRDWLSNSVGRQRIHYVHQDIPVHLAQALGVKSDRENVLSRLGQGMPFGQKEPLSTRIKNILDNYPSDEGVLKELLQNADDAGATELRFILDKRSHPAESVFNDNWKQLQGPAFCVYNNKPFTSNDLAGICNLGQGSKSSDPTKTGQYGIGFNSVYHLTDVPTFLTCGEEIGRTFGILDPTLAYAPGASTESPGRLYQKDHFHEVYGDFPDAFSCYLEDKLNLDGATLFRLPLRRRGSEIRNKAIDVQSAERLLKSFETDLFQNLLFVNSVRTIMLETIGGQGSLYSYSIQATISNGDQEALKQFNEYVKSVSMELKEGTLRKIEDVKYREVIYVVSIQDSRGQKQTWNVCQCIGLKQCQIPAAINQAIASKDLALLPRGGAAILLNSSAEFTKRRLFCFLPLPSNEDTQLPIHVNGHFALDSARRALWFDVNESGYKGLWNTMIMEKVVAQAYVSLIEQHCATLKKQKDVTISDLETLHKMFPNVSKQRSPYLTKLVKAFYTTAKERQIDCLAAQVATDDGIVITRWFSISQSERGDAFFDDLSPAYVVRRVPRSGSQMYRGYTQQQPTYKVVKEKDEQHSLTNILCRLGFNLLCAPMFIYSSLRSVETKVQKVEPQTVHDYLSNYNKYPDCTLKQLPLPVAQSPYEDTKSVETVIVYCFSQTKAASIVGLPLCVSGNGMLQEFSENVKLFSPSFAYLAPDHADRFVNENIFHAIPIGSRSKEPLALIQLRIKDLVPLLLPSKQYLQNGIVYEWMPTTDSQKNLKQWIELLWVFINEEVQAVYKETKNNREMSLKCLEPLKYFCIIPAYDEHQRKHLLYQVEMAKCVLSSGNCQSRHFTSTRVLDLLLKAGIPQMDTTQLPLTAMYDIALPRELVSHIDDPRGVLFALWNRLQNEPNAARLRTVTAVPNNSVQLREYFTMFFKNQCTAKEAHQLRELPMFEFVNGSISALNAGCQGCYLVPQGIPKAGLDNWYSRNTHGSREQFIFQSDSDVDKLYYKLGAVKKTMVDLYVTLILIDYSFQSFLQEHEQLQHVDFLRQSVIPTLSNASAEYKALIAKLQDLPFLKNANGDWQLARVFFDPNVPLFKAMETSFPPEQFCDEKRLEFLTLCGLRTTVTGEDLVRYAYRIEQEGKAEPTDATEEKAKLICRELHIQEKQTLFQLKDVAFIPIGRIPQKFSSMHCQLGLEQPEKAVFICCQDSVMYSNFMVCWTSAKIIPAWFETCLDTGQLKHLGIDKEQLKHLGIETPVPLSKTVDHCIRLTRQLSKLNLQHSKPKNITGVMTQIYEHLEKASKRGETSQLKKLTNEPCVWLEDVNCLVYPQQAVVHLESYDEIPPYLYQLPEILWRYVDVLKHIGVKKEPNHKHYMMVLKMIKEDIQGARLETDINKSSAASRAILKCMMFLSLCKENDHQCDVPLYLISRNRTLEISTDLYHVDKPGWENRIDGGFPLPLLLIPDDHTDSMRFLKYLVRIPTALRPKNLSNVVVEVMNENDMQITHLNDNTSSWFQDRIKHDDFNAGLMRLLTCDAIEQEYDENFGEYWNKLESHMQSVQFLVVDKLETILKLKGGNVIAGTSCNSQKVLIKTTGVGCMVYIGRDRIGNKRISFEEKRDYADLTKHIIGECFPRLNEHTLCVLEDLFTAPLDEIQRLLDSHKIKACSLMRLKLPPILGDYIPLNRHCLLAPDFLQFFKGEYIGYELEDPLNEGGDGQATYIYARVKGPLPTDDDDEDLTIRQYEIDVGGEKIKVFSSTMFKLTRYALVTAEENIADQDYDFEKIKRQIAADLDFAFYKLTVEDRNRVLKRLVMKWQPENHAGHEEVARQVLQFVDKRVRTIEGDVNYIATNRRSGGSGGTPWYGVEHISSYAHKRAQEQRQHIHQQRQWLDANTSIRSGLSDPTDYSYFRNPGMNPQPGEAKRWYRQALMDLQASKYDRDGTNDAYEWALYKCHQAAEKALKAAYFTKDSRLSMSHDLVEAASYLRDRDQTVQSLAQEIANELDDGSKLRYPNRLTFPSIPHDLYGEETCTRIYGLTERLVRRVGCVFLNQP